LNRSAPLARTARLVSCSKLSRSKPMAKRGARGKREESALIAFRYLALARALYRCERCGRAPTDSRRLEAHHRLPRSRGGAHTLENSACLCTPCHRAIHSGSVDWRDWIVETKPSR
jgi:5-methylcytosine-specific restriction endonuclease McrA